MPQLLSNLSLFPGESRAPTQSMAVAQGRVHTWISVCLNTDSVGSADVEYLIESLAIWARMFTPVISIVAPNVLLLEVAGSLKLFGGLEAIKRVLNAQLRKRSLVAQVSVAPTANAAVWLSRYTNIEIGDRQALLPALRKLPLRVTGWPVSVVTSLSEMGVKHIGDVLRLPRNGLAKRIGTRYLNDIDRAFGKVFDAPKLVDWPESLQWQVDLGAETNDAALIIEAAEILAEKMSVALRKRQKQIRSFRFNLHHLHREPSIASFELLEQDHDKRRVLDLLAHRLDKLYLPAPVIAVVLQTAQLLDTHGPTEELFIDDPNESAVATRTITMRYALIERVRERFGRKSVHGVALAADHRPEFAWLPCHLLMPVQASQANISPWSGERPLWLLNTPVRYDIDGLRMEKGVERIDSGWWDNLGISRDYYQAWRDSGERLWVYFDNASKAWYLHGVFG